MYRFCWGSTVLYHTFWSTVDITFITYVYAIIIEAQSTSWGDIGYQYSILHYLVTTSIHLINHPSFYCLSAKNRPILHKLWAFIIDMRFNKNEIKSGKSTMIEYLESSFTVLHTVSCCAKKKCDNHGNCCCFFYFCTMMIVSYSKNID